VGEGVNSVAKKMIWLSSKRGLLTAVAVVAALASAKMGVRFSGGFFDGH
jgi:hypothetical protein